MVLTMAQSIKNTFAPINRVPPEILSLIPDYCETEKELIRMTHVCRGWREIFTSCASLWTVLDCTNSHKTNVYIQRSRGAPLEVSLEIRDHTRHHDISFFLMLPHIVRLKALTLHGPKDSILGLIKYLGPSPAPLLKLDIRVYGTHCAAVENIFFDRSFSSLRELRLSFVLTDLPWKNLSNLTTFHFEHVQVTVTQLLDFFERAPLLCEIQLWGSLLSPSNAPAERVLSIPRLRSLRINGEPVHSILLNHLLIPNGAFVRQEFHPSSTPSIPDYLPRSLDNLGNLSHITSIILRLDSGIFMCFKGPSGGLDIVCTWTDSDLDPPELGDQILRFLNKFRTSTTESLEITEYHVSGHPDIKESGTYQTLLPMNNLRTLTLTRCVIHSFLLALNPNRNASNTVVCPKLEELVLYTPYSPAIQDGSCIDGLLEMVKERASWGAKLSAIVIDCPSKFISAEKMLDLRRYASRVEHIPDDSDSDW